MQFEHLRATLHGPFFIGVYIGLGLCQCERPIKHDPSCVKHLLTLGDTIIVNHKMFTGQIDAAVWRMDPEVTSPQTVPSTRDGVWNARCAASSGCDVTSRRPHADYVTSCDTRPASTQWWVQTFSQKKMLAFFRKNFMRIVKVCWKSRPSWESYGDWFKKYIHWVPLTRVKICIRNCLL